MSLYKCTPHLHLKYYVPLLFLQLKRDIVGIRANKGSKDDQEYSSVPQILQLKTEKGLVCASG